MVQHPCTQSLDFSQNILTTKYPFSMWLTLSPVNRNDVTQKPPAALFKGHLKKHLSSIVTNTTFREKSWLFNTFTLVMAVPLSLGGTIKSIRCTTSCKQPMLRICTQISR